MIKVIIEQPVIVEKQPGGYYSWAIPTHGNFDHSSLRYVDAFFKNKNLKYQIKK